MDANLQQGIIAGGDLYMDFLDENLLPTGYQMVGNAKKFSLKVETETKENKLNGRDTLGQTADSYTRITSSTVSIAFNRYDPNILAAAFMGSASTLSGGAFDAAVTGLKDKWVDIGKAGLAAVTVKDAAGQDDYEEGTDYEINKRTGMIMALTATLDGKVLRVSGTASAGAIITGSTRPTINVALRLDGKNYVNGQEIQIRVFQAQIKSDTDFDFLADDFPELTFTGTMITPAGKSWPFEME